MVAITTTITAAEESSPKLIAQRAKYGVLLDANGKEFAIPDYSLKQILEAIPKECFERSLIKSFRYLFQDLTLVITTFLLFSTYNTSEYISSGIARFALWSLYGFLQMIFGCGVWVIAHECGHMAFSPYKAVNDTVGLILHSAMLVPYFSWTITHRHHHKNHGSMAKDTAFTPPSQFQFSQSFNKSIEEIAELAEDTPIYALISGVIQQVFTWQAYTLIMMGVGEAWFEKKAMIENVEPEKDEEGTIKRTYGLTGSHFNPYSPFFTDNDVKSVYVTDAALAVVFAGLYWVGKTYGWSNLMLWYCLPYVTINACVVFHAAMQHLDPSLPHYSADQWTFIRGAASTIDRDFGFIGRYIWHNLNETHILHHHVSTIPHYHARQATEAIKPVLGLHYQKDHAGISQIFNTFYKLGKLCQWVESSPGSIGDGKGVLFFHGVAGVGKTPML